METNANQKVTCIVNYAYDASEPDELSVRPGDVVREVERLPGGWWRGELRGRRGMFPDNFVSLANDHTGTRSAVQGRCRAVFSYQPANPDELPLCVGDVIDVLGEVEEGWWQGRRQGRVGVFPSNFVVMLDPPQPTAPFEPAPALPPKPVKEQCKVLFPYTAVNDDELSLSEGDIVTIVSKEAPDRGWWRGELHGRVGLFPDNFVTIVSTVAQDVGEARPERPPSKTNAIYPILNKYSEKTASVKELTTSKISLHKENTISKENTTQSTVTHTNKSESEKIIHSETVSDGSLDGQTKKPPVPLKKSPTPTSGVGGLFSGLKSKMLPSAEKDGPPYPRFELPPYAKALLTAKNAATRAFNSYPTEENRKNLRVLQRNVKRVMAELREKEKEKEKEKPAPPTTGSSGSSSGGEWDRPDGAALARQSNANTFDHVERNSILNDPRAGRVKAPRRRPPSQVIRDDAVPQIGLSNGHEAEKPPSEKADEIKPRAREWEKHKAPWMAELKLNQAKKTSFGSDGKSRSVSSSESVGVASKAGGGSTDRILDCGLEEKRSTHSMEMSRSTSSISNRISVLESFEETKVRHSLDSKKDAAGDAPAPKPAAQSPTAAGRTLLTMLEEIQKPAPAPPAAPAPAAPAPPARASDLEKSPSKLERTLISTDRHAEHTKLSNAVLDNTTTVERMEWSSSEERPPSVLQKGSTLERRAQKTEHNDIDLIAQLNNRITNLEKLLEVQNAKFNAAIEELNRKLSIETEKRLALQADVEKLAHCVTAV